MGKLWERMHITREELIEGTYHSRNHEQMLIMGHRAGYRVTVRHHTGTGWMDASFEAIEGWERET